jgi:hemerythrin
MITFTNDLETGVPAIDEQHRELINRINTVISSGVHAAKEETEKTLKFLSDYVDTHFGDEERLQKSFNYPQYSWHHDQHNIYTAEVDKLLKEYRDNGYSIKYKMQLDKSIIDWIIKHIKTADVAFGRWHKKAQTAG